MAVQDYLMLLNAKPARRELTHAAHTSDQIEQAVALLAQKEMMVVPGGALVVRRQSRDSHYTNMPA